MAKWDRWSDSELEILSRSDITDYEKAKLIPGRSDASVRMQRRRLGYTSKMVEFCREFESNGYVHKRIKGGYRREHIIIVEEAYRRKLKADEVVHHINGIKNDNRIENLVILTKSEHNALHANATKLFKPLLEKGIIEFDKEKKRYVLCRDI